MWDFEHEPRNVELAERYQVHYTQPALCADEVIANRADLGLIPIASLTPDLAIVPGCAIASLDRVRSIQLVVKLKLESDGSERLRSDGLEPADRALAAVRTVAADTASRSSLAYAQILFRRFIGTDPEFLAAPADPVAMLVEADAALLIGDPALLALEARDRIEAHSGVGPCVWLDLAHEWRIRTGLPWVAAVWAIRPGALAASGIEAAQPGVTRAQPDVRAQLGVTRAQLGVTRAQLIEDLLSSRDHGLAHIEQLVAEWTPRIDLPPDTIRNYLGGNIHYTLDPSCIAAIEIFRRYAAEADILPALPNLRFL